MHPILISRRSLLAGAGIVSIVPAALATAQPADDGAAFMAVVQLSDARPGAGNHRWAVIEQGEVRDGQRAGVIQGGRLDWHVDPGSGAAEAVLVCEVAAGDGVVTALRRSQLAATRLDAGLVLLRGFHY